MSFDHFICPCNSLCIKILNITIIPEISFMFLLVSACSPEESLVCFFSPTYYLCPRTSCKWNHTVHVCCVRVPTWHRFLRYIHVTVYVSSFILLYCWVVYHCLSISQFVYCSLVDTHLGCFQCGTTMNAAVMSILVQVFCKYVFHSLW